MPYSNPADYAMPYVNQIQDKTQQYYDPFYQSGMNQIPNLEEQYNKLMSDPSGFVNQLGSGYHQSTGFKSALEQALSGANHAAAAGGMAGSPESQQHNIELATNSSNKDYQDYIDRALGVYKEGLGGSRDLVHGGQQAGSSMADMIAQQLAQQGQLGYAGQENKNQYDWQQKQFNQQNKQNKWNNLFQGVGALSAFLPWNFGHQNGDR